MTIQTIIPCCEEMNSHIKDESVGIAPTWDEVLQVTNPIIPKKEDAEIWLGNGGSVESIKFCPWCGKKIEIIYLVAV